MPQQMISAAEFNNLPIGTEVSRILWDGSYGSARYLCIGVGFNPDRHHREMRRYGIWMGPFYRDTPVLSWSTYTRTAEQFHGSRVGWAFCSWVPVPDSERVSRWTA